jgi:RNA recognition motif-containing protein
MTSEQETTEPKSVDEVLLESVAERLAFFFSDSNVRGDRYMKNLLVKDGSVPIENLLRFNSIKVHTTDAKVLVEAAKRLEKELTLNADETAIGRAVAYDPATMDSKNVDTTLMVSNLPLDGDSDDAKTRYGCTIDQIRSLFASYGKVAIVKLRFARANTQKIKEEDRRSKGTSAPLGSAFVEFTTTEALQSAVADLVAAAEGEEPKTKLTLNKNELSFESMKTWLENKKSKRKRDAEDGTPDQASKKVKLDDDDQKEEVKVEVKEFALDWKQGCVVRIEGLPTETCDRESIRAALEKHMGMDEEEFGKAGIYVDYSRGQANGAVRFPEPVDKVGELSSKLKSGDLLIADTKVTDAKVLEGDEESKYWTDFIDFKKRQIASKAEEKANKKKNFRGGNRRGGGRR